MATISASVGIRGKNREKDVKIVQRLLNNHLTDFGRNAPVSVDGVVGPQTTRAIIDFQIHVVGLIEPDGRVDPRGRTLRMLSQECPEFVRLPKNGTGYYHYAKSKNQFGTKKTIRSIQNVAKQASQRHGLEIGVGHISRRHGGAFPPHRSHRRGIDVDLRPLRDDGRRRPVTIEDERYSRTRTRKIVRLLRADPNVEQILFNDDGIAGITSFPGHHNHLHVRFKA